MNLKQRIIKSYSLDLRSLGLMRIVIGFLAMVDVIGRSCDLVAHYTDQGIFPRIYWVTDTVLEGNISFHGSNGGALFISLLFAVHFFIALSFTLGFKTKLFTVLLFLFTASLHNRAWVYNNGGDDIFRVMLFVCQFLPLGNYFSIDSRKGMFPQKYTISWVMGFTFFVQMFCIYYFSAILKNHPIWFKDYTATYYALQLDFFVRPSAAWLSGHPDLLKFITFVTIYLEWLVIILFLFNFIFGRFQDKFRTIVVFVFIFFHLGLALMMDLGVFPWFCMGFWLGFLPSIFWEHTLVKSKISFSRGGQLIHESNIKKSFGIFLVVLIIGWNVAEMKSISSRPSWLIKAGSYLQIQQKWNMFAPYPKLINTWMEGNGYAKDGTKIDLFNESYDFEKNIKKRFYKSIKNKQWKKFYLLMTEHEQYVKYFAEYMCRKFNKLKTARIATDLHRVELFLYRQQTLIGYLKDREERIPIFRMECP